MHIQDAYRQNPHLPTPGYKHAYTKHEIDEFIKCQNDPLYFIENYCKIVTIDHGLVPFKLYDCQKRLIKSYHENNKTIVLSGRQIGKSETAAAYICWWMIFNEHKTGAILANKAMTAREILGRIQRTYENLPMFLKKGVVVWNRGSIELDGDIKVIAASTAASSIRGFTISLLFLDEFAHVKHTIAEEFWTSTYPTLSSGKTAKVIVTSTPNGFNLYRKLWVGATKGENGFNPVEIHWSEIPGRDEKWKQEKLAVLGPEKFNQEFEAEFLGSTHTLIHSRFIREMIDDKILYEAEGMTIYQEPIKEHTNYDGSITEAHTYLIVADPSEGTGNDDHAVIVFDVTEFPIKIVAKFQDNTLSHLLLPSVIERLAKSYNDAYVLGEVNNNGNQVMDILYQDLEYENVIFTQKRANSNNTQSSAKGTQMGVRTTTPVKRNGCALFKDLVENHKLLINDTDLISQISTFIRTKKGWEAEDGHKDDLVMCCVLLSWFTGTEEFKELLDINFPAKFRRENLKRMEEQMMPMPFMDDGLSGEFGIATEDDNLPPGWVEVFTFH